MATDLKIRPDEISEIIKQQILESKREIDVYETGTVLYVGDGVSRVHGLANVMAGELVEFPHGIMGMTLNDTRLGYANKTRFFLKLMKRLHTTIAHSRL